MNATKNAAAGDTPTLSNPESINGAEIGASIKVIGDMSGKEDLVINGNVEGTVDFRESDVTVGESGKVNANINAKNIIVYGEVKGELRGREQVTIKSSGRVNGDIRAPRVALDDGCQFKGAVDMEEKANSSGESRNAAASLSAGTMGLGAKPLSNPNPSTSPSTNSSPASKLFGGRK